VLAKCERQPSLVILDVLMPRKGGISTLKDIRRKDPNLPVIMLSGISTQGSREQAMSSGANHFLTKPVSHAELRQAVEVLLPPPTSPKTAEVALAPPAMVPRAAELHPSKHRHAALRTAAWMRKLEPMLQRIAQYDVPVLLQGETGAGKEVLARQLHNQSLRATGPFLKLNCAALPSELVESELFGYERGAFTGAFKNNPGKFELADGGTILLDEIGDMDLRLQAKLLQVLQDHEFHRLGAKDPTQVNVRVIAATHRNLVQQIEEGGFREDLYYRLNVVNIEIPPLRHRQDEIMPLASFFLEKHTPQGVPLLEITQSLKQALLEYQWPGNVRELENIMRRYLVVRSPELIVEDLTGHSHSSGQLHARGRTSSPSMGARSRPSAESPDSLASAGPSSSARQSNDPADAGSLDASSDGCIDPQDPEFSKLDQARRAFEIELIKKTLYSTQWNRKGAAKRLGMDYKALLYRMKKLGIE
jgi:DNA-binding NtrC family response regulator